MLRAPVLTAENSSFPTDSRQTTVSFLLQPFCHPFTKEYLFLPSRDLCPFSGHACGHVLQKPTPYLLRGRGYIYYIGPYPFNFEKDRSIYTSLNKNSWTDGALLPPANFRGAQIIITVQILKGYYWNQTGVQFIEYSNCLRVPWHNEWEMYSNHVWLLYTECDVYSQYRSYQRITPNRWCCTVSSLLYVVLSIFIKQRTCISKKRCNQMNSECFQYSFMAVGCQ